MIPITDTHQHLVYPERWPYDWAVGYLPRDGEGFRLADYRQAIAGTGITRSVFMETGLEPPHDAAETDFALDLVRDDPLVAGVIANCRPESTEREFQEWLIRFHRRRLSGLRRILHVMPDALSTTPNFRANVARLGARKLPFDMCFLARQLDLAVALARACPNTQFVLDHCGVPDIAGGDIEPWRAGIRRVAALPNVACKISGIAAYCAPGTVSSETLRPYVEHCIESFGWNRVVWGGDWPVCCTTSSLADWVRTSRELVADASEDEQRKLFHINAARIYGLRG